MEDIKNKINESEVKIALDKEWNNLELITLKSKVNMLKSICHMNIDSFNSKSEAYYFINKCNNIIAKIAYFQDDNQKLLDIILKTSENMPEHKKFINECRKSLITD